MICHYPTKKSTIFNFFSIPGCRCSITRKFPRSSFHYIGNKFREEMRLDRENGLIQQISGENENFTYSPPQGGLLDES
jgi:hypothetical protein